MDIFGHKSWSSTLINFSLQTTEDEELPLSTKTERAKSSWGDEDEDEIDVRESWEDELVEPAPEPMVSKNVRLPLIAEEHLQERFVEKADFESRKAELGEKNDDKALDNFIPKSESDFSEYADLISHRLHLYENSFHYVGLLKAVMRLCTTVLKAGDAKEVASSVAAIANEKLKNEKEANKKKIVAKKKQLQVDKATDDAIVDAYDDHAFL